MKLYLVSRSESISINQSVSVFVYGLIWIQTLFIVKRWSFKPVKESPSSILNVATSIPRSKI